MNEMTIHRNPRTNAIVISNRFIDEYMTKANGEFVKIYLYLLRCMGAGIGSVSVSDIADHFEHTEKDVRRALAYWEKLNVLKLEYGRDEEIKDIYFTDLGAADTIADSAAYMTDPKGNSCPAPRARKKELQEKADVKQLLFVAEQYLGCLSATDVDRIFYYYDELGFSADLIEYLIEYCVSKGVRSLHYADKVALEWKNAGITTVSGAKARTNTYNRNCFAILKAFGIRGRDPAKPELEYIDRWIKEYGFEQDIILEAVNRTMKALHQPNFGYTEKILLSWKEQGVKHLNDIRKLDAEHQKSREYGKKVIRPERAAPSAKNKFNNFEQRNYDYDKLEKELLEAQRA